MYIYVIYIILLPCVIYLTFYVYDAPLQATDNYILPIWCIVVYVVWCFRGLLRNNEVGVPLSYSAICQKVKIIKLLNTLRPKILPLVRRDVLMHYMHC